MSQVIIVIPAYEPDYRLIELVQKLKDYDVLVVDDGSGEDYAHIFLAIGQSGSPVIGYEDNQGKGYALKTAFKYIKQNYPDNEWVISADADGQHTIEDIKKISKMTEGSTADLLIGTRKFTGYVPLRSRIGNKVASWLFHMLTGKKIPDTQSGLRAYPSFQLEKFCKIKGQRYEYETNCLLQCANIQTIPIETVYQKGNKSSHYRMLKDSFMIWTTIVRMFRRNDH